MPDPKQQVKDLPTDGWNPVSVEKAILETVNEAARGITIASDSYQKFLDTQRAHKKALSRAFMRHHGPQTEKKIAAELDEDVMRLEVDRDAADVAYRYCKDLNALLNDKLDALRSVGVSVRQSYANAGTGEW